MYSYTNSSKFQTGQGLVEYAILLLLTITLVIGGVELAATAMASNKATEAAKAGVNEYAEVNEERIRLQTKIQRNVDRYITNDEELNYLDQLDQLVKNEIDGAFDQGNYLWTNYAECFSIDGDPDSDACSSGIDLVGAPTGLIEAEILKIDSIDGIGNNDGTLDIYELYHAVSGHEETTISGDKFDIFDAILDINPSDIEDEYYKAIVLFDHIKLSTLPMDPRIKLSESVPLLGDHDMALMSKPRCDASNPTDILYFNGFYGEDLDVDGDGIPFDGVAHQAIGAANYPAVYLFNPFQINANSCSGSDAQRGNTLLLSILVNGYSDPGDPNYVKGLPKLHQAYYSQYQNICLNASNEYVNCTSNIVVYDYLKPPGKLCLSSVASSTVDSCPGLDAIDPAYIDSTEQDYVTGYYFWGKANESDPAVNGRFKWVKSQLPEFRPSFQLLCNGDTSLSELIVGDKCKSIFDSDSDGDVDSDDQASDAIHKLKINVRYRSVFESFLAFGMHELQDSLDLGLVNYFYDPANLRSLGFSDISGSIVGSELGPKQENGLPTVKPFKDFRGCYTLDVSSNQISACN